MIAFLKNTKNDNYSLKRRGTHFLLLAIILFLGLYLRLTMVSETQITTPFLKDAKEYTAYAYNLKMHGIYSRDLNGLRDNHVRPKPDAVRPPGYPLFLFLFTDTKKLDRFAFNVFYLQAIFSTLTIFLVYYIARRSLGSISSLFTAALTAASPHLVASNVYLLTESFFTLILIAFLAILITAFHSEKILLFFIAGITLACASLVRSTLQYYLIFFFPILFLDDVIEKKKTIFISIIIPFAVVFSMWYVRNLVAIGSLSDPSLMINTIHHGMYPQFMFEGRPETFALPYHYDPATPEIGSSLHRVLAEILDRFITDPQKHILWYLSKPLYLFRWSLVQGHDIFVYPFSTSPYESNFIFKICYKVMRFIHSFVVISGFIGSTIVWLPKCCLLIKRKQLSTIRILSSIYFYFIIIHIAGAPFPRYSIPIRPLTYIFAVLPAFMLYDFFLRKQSINKAEETIQS